MINNELFWYRNKSFTRLRLELSTDGLEGWKDGEWVYGDKDDPALPPDTPTTPPDLGNSADWSGMKDLAPPTGAPEYKNSSSGKYQGFVDRFNKAKEKVGDFLEKAKDTIDDLNPVKKLVDWLGDKEKEGEEIFEAIDEEIKSGRARDFDEAIQSLKDQGKIRERERSALGKAAQKGFDTVVGGVSRFGALVTELGGNEMYEGVADQMRDATLSSEVKRDAAFNYELTEGPTKSAKEAQENRYKEEIERNKAQAAAQGKPAAEQNVQKKAETVLVESSEPPSLEQKVEKSTKSIQDWLDGRFGESGPNYGVEQPRIPDTPPSDIFPSWAWPSPTDDSGSITLDKTKSGNFSDITWNDQFWEEHVGNSYMREIFYVYDDWKYPKGYADEWTVFMAIYVRKQTVEEL